MAKTSRKGRTTTGRPSSRKGDGAQGVQQTKKQVMLGRREARQNRTIWLSISALGVAILLILAVGFVSEVLVKPAKPVASVNGTKIRTDDFQELLTFRRYNLHVNIENLQASMQTLTADDETSELIRSFYEEQIGELQTALAMAPQSTVDELIESQLILEKAEELQITVTPDEVEGAILDIVDELRQSAATPAQDVITGTEQVPTPTPFPQDLMYDLYLQSMHLSKSQYQPIIQRSLLRDKVQAWFAGQVISTGLVAHVQLIKTETEEEALAAEQRIQSGEEFALVAQEVSTDTLSAADGGDLGWVTPGQLSGRYGQDLESAVFAMDVGQLDLLQSNESFYLVMVLERDENGPLPEAVLGPLQDNAMLDWLAEQKEAPETVIETLLEPSQIPTDPFLAQSSY